MLTNIKIRNYALIKELDIDFSRGFTIITGETGAGKSILLGALSLILGQRADTSSLKNKEKKCVVEGTFKLHDNSLQDFFKQNELDYDNSELIIRREISSAGKSRAFINDTPVNLKLMRQLSLNLIDIHSQHQNLELGEHLFQLKVLDTCAGHHELLSKYKSKFNSYKKLCKELEDLQEKAEKASSDTDYFQFQFDQLDEAGLIENEQEELEKELETITHAEEIKSNLSGISNLLNGEGSNTLTAIREGMSMLSKLTEVFEPATQLHSRLESSYYELQDIAEEAEREGEAVEFNPTRQQILNERLDLIYSLQQKHRVDSVSDLIEIKDKLEKQLSENASFDDEIEKLQIRISKEKEQLEKTAAQISRNRKKNIVSTQQRVIEILVSLGMPNTQFQIELEPVEQLTPTGKDRVKFLFSANKSMQLEEIAKVASGGEMSRLMLAIKAILSDSLTIPTIIFDEIDTGISGEIAARMGGILKQMAQTMQVINITHLPQIAASGNQHLFVYKHDQAEETVTNIRLLTHDERVLEIAKMLSGETPTEAALNNAMELLK